MRLNRMSILLVPLMCLSLISCGANDIDDCKEMGLLIQKEYKSFSNYIWHFSNNKQIINKDDNFKTTSEL